MQYEIAQQIDLLPKWEEKTKKEWKNTPFKTVIIKEYKEKILELKQLKENIKYFELLKQKQLKYNKIQWSLMMNQRKSLERKIVHIQIKHIPNINKVIKKEIHRLTKLKNSI